MTKILRSRSLSANDFRAGDLVQVYVKQGKERRGKWWSPRQVININNDDRMLSVPGTAGLQIVVAFEDARAAHVQSEITYMITDSTDNLDYRIENILSTSTEISIDDHIQNSSEELSTDQLQINNNDVGEYSILSDNDDEHTNTSNVEDVSPQPETLPPFENYLPSGGDRLEIFRTMENVYYKEPVFELTPNGKHAIVYGDEDVVTLIMSDKNWKYEVSTHAELGSVTTLPSDEQRILQKLMSVCGNQSSLCNQAQGFENFPHVNAYFAEGT